jgi:hypothetical protein
LEVTELNTSRIMVILEVTELNTVVKQYKNFGRNIHVVIFKKCIRISEKTKGCDIRISEVSELHVCVYFGCRNSCLDRQFSTRFPYTCIFPLSENCYLVFVFLLL